MNDEVLRICAGGELEKGEMEPHLGGHTPTAAPSCFATAALKALVPKASTAACG